jgi:hypothetical protein
MSFLLLLTIIAFIMTVRALLVVVGAYKDPVLASFEVYGDERIFSPMFSFLAWGTGFAYIMLYWYINSGLAFSLGLILAILLAAFRNKFIDMLYEYHESFRIFPLWYYKLTQNTDREERRRLAYLWLRLPKRTRMIYNTHTIFFWQWVEQTLVTISR